MKNIIEKDYHGYTIRANGEILGLNGRPLSYSNKHKLDQGKRLEVRLVINGKRKSHSVARLIYSVFNNLEYDSIDKDKYVTYKDGDRANVSIDNLELVNKGYLVQNENQVKCKLTNEEVQEIKDKYESTKHIEVVNQYSKDYDKKYTLQKLADEYNTTKQNIGFIVRGETRHKNTKKY